MTEPSRALAALEVRHRLLRPGDPGFSAYTRDVVMQGEPEAVARPGSVDELCDLVCESSRNGIPVTPAGGQTGLTGGGVATEGLLLSTEKLDRILDIGRHPATGGWVAVAEPGIFLGELQRRLTGEGWFYPPDPTSRNEARLGATVATNATGEDTLLFGPTRRWVRELEVVTGRGEVRTLIRPADSAPREEKATPGYYPGSLEIDHVVGSEGTLAVITRVTVDLLPGPRPHVAGLVFFPSLAAALRFVVEARRREGLAPRALELLDAGSLDLVRGNPEGFRWPEEATGIVFKQETPEGADRVLGSWLALLEEHLEGNDTQRYLDASAILTDGPGQERLRGLRHRVPATLNEHLEPLRDAGGGKLGTDWWVPFDRLPAFLLRWTAELDRAGLRYIVFGHVGNGHPHVNLIARDAAERERGWEIVRRMCREAVELGGGVAGEHGLGKTKRELLSIQHSPGRIREMRDLKTAWDPGWILGRGNLFAPEES